MHLPRALALICAYSLILVAGNPVSAYEDRGIEAVRDSFDAHDTVNYIGEIETIRFQSRRAEATIVRVEHRAPNYTHRWYVAPPTLFGDSVVLHDHKSFEFDEHHHTLIESTNKWNDEADEANRKALLGKNFMIVVAGTGIIAGRRVQRVNVLQRTTGRRLVTLALDTETHLPLERESYRSDGSIAYRMRFNSIRYVAQDHLPLTIFSTATPTGFRVIERNVATERRTYDKAALLTVTSSAAPIDLAYAPPENFPDGFHLLRSTNTILGGTHARQWIYSDGIRSLSLFASPLDHPPIFKGLQPRQLSISGKPAFFVEVGSDALLSWQAKAMILTLVGDLTAEELVTIAKRSEP